MNYEQKDIIRESKQLYGEINSCISDIINARIAKDLYNEGRAIFKMEGLMVSTMQHLGCVIDFLEEQDECLADDSKTSESEDERIRKGLIEALKVAKTVGELKFILPNPTREEAIAWLEKQKEQKDFRKLYEDIAKSEWFKKAYEGKSLGELASSASWKDDEQKPADEPFEEWLDSWFKEHCSPKHGLIHMNEKEFKNWSRGIRNMFEQKPVEWSDDEEQLLGFIFDLLESLDWRKEWAMSKKECLERIKSLRPGWKPSSNTYKDIIHDILAQLKGMDFTKITPEHRVSLLNDIRVKCKNADECAEILDEPSWKPSEEQISAIVTALKYVPNNMEECMILDKFINDLKTKL